MKEKMQISSRFTITTHMIITAMQDTDSKVTSDFLAASVGVNPVIIVRLYRNSKKQIDFSCAGWAYRDYKDLQDISLLMCIRLSNV